MNKTIMVYTGCGIAECGLIDAGAIQDGELSITLYKKETKNNTTAVLELSTHAVGHIVNSFISSSSPVYNAVLFSHTEHKGEIDTLFELSSNRFFESSKIIDRVVIPEYTHLSTSHTERLIFIRSFITTLLMKASTTNRPIYLYGDLKIFVENGEAEIKVIESGPECDPVLETAALISVFTDKGYWGNYDEKENPIGCDVSKIKQATSNSRKEASMYIENSLGFLIEQSLAKSIEVNTYIPAVGKLAANITIEKPDGEKQSMYWENSYQ